MPLLIDISILAIIAFCTWRGFRSGLVRGVLGLVGFIVAIVLANIVASTYAEEFSGIVHPFVGGVLEATITDIVDDNIDLNSLNPDNIDFGDMGLSDIDYIDPDLLDMANLPGGLLSGGLMIPAIEHATAYAALRHVGLPDAAANRIADIVSQEAEVEMTIGGFTEAITGRLAYTMSFIILFGIGFALISIAISIIGNIVSIAFVLPGLKTVDAITGAVLGLAKGLVIVFAITAVMRYVGIFVSDLIAETSLLNFFINNNPVANALGI